MRVWPDPTIKRDHLMGVMRGVKSGSICPAEGGEGTDNGGSGLALWGGGGVHGWGLATESVGRVLQQECCRPQTEFSDTDWNGQVQPFRIPDCQSSCLP